MDLVVLIHGFGASKGHWRHNLVPLARHAEVIAVDLLGFGASDKPPSRLADEPAEPGAVRYSFDLWAAQVVDLVQHEGASSARRRVHLIGNSIGAMVALTAARQLEQLGQPAAQVILIDCAQRTLDDKRLGEQPPLAQLTRPLLKQVVRQRWLVAALFQLLATPTTIRRVLQQAYPSGAHVDAELVELLLAPTREAGARESFRGFINLFNDHLAPELLAELHTPVRMLWGGADPWEDPAEAERWAAAYPVIQELQVLEGLGHCPHDEAPAAVNPLLVDWLRTEPPLQA